MRFTKENPLVIGEPGGTAKHVVSTGTAIGWDVDLHEELWVSGKDAAAEIKRGLFVVVDDNEDGGEDGEDGEAGVARGSTVPKVTFQMEGPFAVVATPVEAASPNVVTSPLDPDGGGAPEAGNPADSPAARRAAGKPGKP